MSQTDSSIIKPSTGGTTILKEEAGGTALTVDAAGDVQIAASMTAGKLGKNVVVPQATTQKVHRYESKRSIPDDGTTLAATASMIVFKWGNFTPLSHLNSFWIEMTIPCCGMGQDNSSGGLFFAGQGVSDVDKRGTGYCYAKTIQPNTAMLTIYQYFGIPASTFASGGNYEIQMRMGNAASSQPGRMMPDSTLDARLAFGTEGTLVIYEYKNYQ